MPIAKLTNTTNRPLKVYVEGGDYTLQPGSSIAGAFTDDEWATAKNARQYLRNADKLDDDADNAKAHLETVDADKGWVSKRETINAEAARALEKGGRA